MYNFTPMKRTISTFVIILALAACNSVSRTEHDGFITIDQSKGPRLSWSPESGVNIIQKCGLAFKDMDKDSTLSPFEDWRESPEKRAADLAGRLSVEELCGLMLASHMQSLPGTDVNHYGGVSFPQSEADAWDLTDEQKDFLKNDFTRSMLMAGAENLETIVRWNNNVQAYAERFGHGIPVAIMSDPRHGAQSDMEFYAGAGGEISRWPSSLGMAATFDPALAEEHGKIGALEYRAMGISTALSPQADVATEPRWWRFDGTFGEGTDLIADMVRAYCDGFQTSEGDACIDGAWGRESVNAMIKHWYGYGAQEGGREAHFVHGEYSVYPGNNLENLRKGFTEGAFKLAKGTGCVSALMSGYQTPWGQNPSGENIGVSFSDYFIRQQLREREDYDGVICTDWGVVFDCTSLGPWGRGKDWGVENLTVAERIFKLIEVGTDQIGDKNKAGEMMDAFKMWSDKYGWQEARDRFEESARRILLNMFRLGIFENPYLVLEESKAVVGRADFMEAGYDMQVKSVVMLKNSDALPRKGSGDGEGSGKSKVYVPKRHFPALKGVWGGGSEEKMDYPVDMEMVKRYFDVVENPSEADFALVMIEEPALNIGWYQSDIDAGGNGYVPITLQYEDYTAVSARDTSIAGGNPLEDFTNRTYKGKTVKTANRDDMLLVRDTKAAMGSKPVVVAVNVSKPMVFSEIEPWADAILVYFGIQKQAVLDIVSGTAEPSGLLPMQMPASMEAVETQMEDVPFDMECYQDTAGNMYDYAFGLNWSGVISDWRTEKYGRK